MRDKAKERGRSRVCDDFFTAVWQDPAHRDSEPDLVFEDMTVMSDFELHCLCREEQVRRFQTYSLSHLALKNTRSVIPEDRIVYKAF